MDNLITDIDGNHIAGAGINLAQRVMSAADGNQILVGQPAFRSYFAEAKHGLRLRVYQLVVDGFPGLDVTTPANFRTEPPAEEKLPRIVGYYIAHAMMHRAEIASCVNNG